MPSSITFVGPSAADPTNPVFVPIVVPIDDAAFLVAAEAVCTNMGYQPTIQQTDPDTGEVTTVQNLQGPGQFVIQKTLDWYHAHVIQYLSAKALAGAQQAAIDAANTQIAQYVVPVVPVS